MDPRYLGLDHVQIAAPRGCEPAARAFYGALLGMTERPKPAPMAARGGAWFDCGAQQLHVGVEEDFRPARKAHPAFRLADAEALDALAASLLASGHAVVYSDELPGQRRFHVDDPWGNRLEFVSAV
jgi:catechol 2,3-dioxygenase-like lactoylglutathione lyase family enzyme